MEPGWHTYWKNPGAAGMATEIKWQLPPGVTAGEIQWPLPKKLPPAEVTTYGYEDEVMLIVPLKIEANSNLPEGQVTLKANVSWLECKEVCIPANQDVEAKFNIGSETKTSADAATIESWKSKTPKLVASLTAYAWWQNPTNINPRSLSIQVKLPKPDTADFFPEASDLFEIQPETKFVFDEYSDSVLLDKLVKKFYGNWPKEVSGVLVISNANSNESFQIELPITDGTTTNEIDPTTSINSVSSVAPTLASSILPALILICAGTPLDLSYDVPAAI